MKLFVLSLLLLSICYGINGRCISDRDSSEECASRVYSEPKPRKIQYIYHDDHKEGCDCLKYHDLIIQKPQEDKKSAEKLETYEFKIQAPTEKSGAEQKVARYLFDVRVEEPETSSAVAPSAVYDYKLQEAALSVDKDQKQNSIRYIFDTRVEQPIKSCKEKPWQGLVTQIDAVLVPKPHTKQCSDPSHTSENCNCGCRSCGQSASKCTCNKDLFQLPIFPLSDTLGHKRVKRDDRKNKKKLSLNLKPANIILPELKKLPKFNPKSLTKIEPKDLASILNGNKKPRQKNVVPSMPPKLPIHKEAIRLKRREKSPCAYEFESCDLKRKTPKGCPLCYKCQCEPSGDRENQKFSLNNIKIPYTIVPSNQNFIPATRQEFDHEPSPYLGLQQPDMYKKYIEQVISKYPEHMSRKMPNIMEQQRDLVEFINELARNDKSPPADAVPNSDVRYQILDDAWELYKLYENAISNKQDTFGNMNKKLFKKRGTVLEVIEVDPDDLKKLNLPNFSGNYSDNSDN